MKKLSNTHSGRSGNKLRLNRETLRRLDDGALSNAAGGIATLFKTGCACSTWRESPNDPIDLS
ncbi:hypothetical protein [Haliangium sp.]|uniref:hypothetical protein n=1 Tax=Haliangium sp. TaxID=2663208 RepID=UPI003D0972F6